MDNQRQFSLLPLLYTCYPQHSQAVYKYSQLPFGCPTKSDRKVFPISHPSKFCLLGTNVIIPLFFL